MDNHGNSSSANQQQQQRTNDTIERKGARKKNDNDTSHANKNTHVAHLQTAPCEASAEIEIDIIDTGKY